MFVSELTSLLLERKRLIVEDSDAVIDLYTIQYYRDTGWEDLGEVTWASIQSPGMNQVLLDPPLKKSLWDVTNERERPGPVLTSIEKTCTDG